MSRTLTIRLNGIEQPTCAATLGQLLAGMGINADARGVAVARNDEVVTKALWDATPINEHDCIEIVRPVPGG